MCEALFSFCVTVALAATKKKEPWWSRALSHIVNQFSDLVDHLHSSDSVFSINTEDRSFHSFHLNK
jgi:hypothetical protein